MMQLTKCAKHALFVDMDCVSFDVIPDFLNDVVQIRILCTIAE